MYKTREFQSKKKSKIGRWNFIISEFCRRILSAQDFAEIFIVLKFCGEWELNFKIWLAFAA